jgi:hypothetical protein
VEDHYRHTAQPLFNDHAKALVDYGKVLARGQDPTAFLDEHCSSKGRGQEEQCLSLLTMQCWSLASFASCAWFFDDIGRIEPINALACALRSLELLAATGGRDVSSGFLEILEEARSNDPSKEDGARIWEKMVLPRRMDAIRLGGMLVALNRDKLSWPGVDLSLVNKREDEYGWKASLKVVWKRTGTRQERNLICTYGSHDQSFRIEDGETTLVVPGDMHERARGYLAWQRAGELESGERKRLVDLAGQWAWLVERFGEGQQTPLGHPGPIVPGLAWLMITGKVVFPEVARHWVRSFFSENMHASNQVGLMLVEEVSTLIDRDPLPEAEILAMISRAREIGVEPYWWEVQNMIWTSGKPDKMVSIARTIGMNIEGDR